MSANTIAPVIAGLAVGIFFIVLFSFFFGYDTVPIAQPIDDVMARQKHEDWLVQTSYNLPEVNAFRQKYPHVGVTGHSSSDFGGIIVCYAVPNSIPCNHEGNNDELISAYLEIRMDDNGRPINFTIYCNSGNGAAGGTAARMDVKAFLEETEHCPK